MPHEDSTLLPYGIVGIEVYKDSISEKSWYAKLDPRVGMKKVADAQARLENFKRKAAYWDYKGGECINAEEYFKQKMNDPDSYEFVSGSLQELPDSTFRVYQKFRGKNAYGAKVLGAFVAIMNGEGEGLDLKETDQ